MAARRKTKGDEPAARVRHLIALDATNVMRRLVARREEMVSLFSRLRTREPMLETLASWFPSAELAQLAALTVSEQVAVSSFYESLAELRWYARYTEDMPSAVQQVTLRHQRRLEVAFRRLIEALGAPSAAGSPVVDADVVAEPEAPALASGAKPRR